MHYRSCHNDGIWYLESMTEFVDFYNSIAFCDMAYTSEKQFIKQNPACRCQTRGMCPHSMFRGNYGFGVVLF